MIPLTKNWKPAPLKSLGQLQQYTREPVSTLDLPASERMTQGLLTVGLGMASGIILGQVMNQFVKPTVLAPSVTGLLGAVMSIGSVWVIGGLEYARTVQFVSGAVTGLSGTQLIKAVSKKE